MYSDTTTRNLATIPFDTSLHILKKKQQHIWSEMLCREAENIYAMTSGKWKWKNENLLFMESRKSSRVELICVHDDSSMKKMVDSHLKIHFFTFSSLIYHILLLIHLHINWRRQKEIFFMTNTTSLLLCCLRNPLWKLHETLMSPKCLFDIFP